MSHNGQKESQCGWPLPHKHVELSHKDGPVHSWEYCIHVMTQLFKLNSKSHTMLQKLLYDDPRCADKIYNAIVESPQYLVLSHPMALYATQLISNNDIFDAIHNLQLWWIVMWRGGDKLSDCGLNFDQAWNKFCKSSMGNICLSDEAVEGGTDWLKNQDSTNLLSKLQKHLTPKDYQRALQLPTQADISPFIEFRKIVNDEIKNEPTMQLLTIASQVSQLLEIAAHHQIVDPDMQRQLVSPNCKFGVKCGKNGDEYCEKPQNSNSKKKKPDSKCLCYWNVKYLLNNPINNSYHERSRENLCKEWRNTHKSSLAKQVYHYLPFLMFAVFCSKQHPLFQHLWKAANPMSKKTNQEAWLILYCRYFRDALQFMTTPDKIRKKQAALPMARSFMNIKSKDNDNGSKDNDNASNNNTQDTDITTTDKTESQDNDITEDDDITAESAHNEDEKVNSAQSLLQGHWEEQQRVGLQDDNPWTPTVQKAKYQTIYQLWPEFEPKYTIDLEFEGKYYHEIYFIEHNCNHQHRVPQSKEYDNESKEYENANKEVTGFALMKHIYQNTAMSQQLNFGSCVQSHLMVQFNVIMNKNDGLWTNIANLPSRMPKNIPKVQQVCGAAENAFLIMKQYKHIEYRASKTKDEETILWIGTAGGSNSLKVGHVLDANNDVICNDINADIQKYVKNIGYDNDLSEDTFGENLILLDKVMSNKPMFYFKTSQYDTKHFQEKMKNNNFKYPADSCLPLGKKTHKFTKNAWFVTEIDCLNGWELNCVHIGGFMRVLAASPGTRHYIWLREHLQPHNVKHAKKNNTTLEDMFEKRDRNTYGMKGVMKLNVNQVEKTNSQPTRQSKRNNKSQEKVREVDEEDYVSNTSPPHNKRRKVMGKLDVNKIKQENVYKTLLDAVGDKLKPQFDAQVDIEDSMLIQAGLSQDQIDVAKNLEIFWGMVNVTTSNTPLVKAFKETLHEFYDATTQDGKTKNGKQ